MSEGARRPRDGVVRELDMAQGALVPPPEWGRQPVYLVLRWHGRPIGRLLSQPATAPTGEAFLRDVESAAAPGLAAARREQESAPGPVRPGEIAVVVASRNRPEDLAACLQSLAALRPAPGRLLAVDSGSSDAAAVRAAAAGAGADCLRLDRPGLSRARNAGAAAVNSPLVAFLDDDCRPDPGWLVALARGFDGPRVLAVTGQLLPSELATPAQQLFLQAFHMDRRGWLPRRFSDRPAPSAVWPLDPWRMGSGGNMAVRREPFLACGGFSPALGLGTPARGGEDLLFLWDAVRRGGEVVYRPDAMAWHRHHRRMSELSRVMFGYGAGHSAFLRAALKAGAPRALVARCALGWLAGRGGRLARGLMGRGPLPALLTLQELAGGAAGPLLGRRAEREARA